MDERGVAVVTGASTGIGAATARRLGRLGWTVCATYLTDERGAATVVAEVEAGGGRAWAVRCDVAVEADVLAAFATVDAAAAPLTAVVANAGVVAPAGRVEDLDAARVTRLLAVNVLGTLLCCREAVRRMSSTNGGAGGSIVTVSSAAVKHGSAGEYVDYAATKGAVDVLTLGLAREVATEGVRVNGVRPGIIDTAIHAPGRIDRVAPLVPMQRAGTAEEVAAAIAWLLSNEASYCTGAILDVSGGR